MIKGMMNKILETLQALMNKEDQPQPMVHGAYANPSNFSAGPKSVQGENDQIPIYGLSRTIYTPPFSNATNRGPSVQPHVQILVATKGHPSEFSVHQDPFENLHIVYSMQPVNKK